MVPRMMLRRLLPLVLASVLPAVAVPVPLWIGTRTGGESKSEGIYTTTFDPAGGTFGDIKLAAAYSDPGFLALHPGRKLVYATGTRKTTDAGSEPVVALFRIENGSKLALLAEAPTGGKNPCHVSVDAAGKQLAAANYGDGRISYWRLGPDGIPIGNAEVLSNEGSGPDKERQDGPHAHGVYFDRAASHLLVPDLGLDKVFVYRVDPAVVKPEPCQPPSVSTEPGAGPRHLAFSPDEKHAYVVDELDSSVTACSYDAATGVLSAFQHIGTLPKDWKGKNLPAEIEVHPNGKYVFASNRGHDSIAVFTRDPATGKLALLQHAFCGGKNPRHFKLSPDGRWLLCAHQDSNTLSALPLDPETGMVGSASTTIPCPAPICILFGG